MITLQFVNYNELLKFLTDRGPVSQFQVKESFDQGCWELVVPNGEEINVKQLG